jgi:hypothetical protein
VDVKLFDEWENEIFGKTNGWPLPQIRSLHLKLAFAVWDLEKLNYSFEYKGDV